MARSVFSLMRHSRAFPASARDAVDGDTPAALATCSRVTGAELMVFGQQEIQKLLAQSFVQCHNNRRKQQNQQGCHRPNEIGSCSSAANSSTALRHRWNFLETSDDV